MEDYTGYKWIKVQKYKMDASKGWEERYKELEQHHVRETNFLINEVRKLAAKLEQHGHKANRQVSDLPAECCYG